MTVQGKKEFIKKMQEKQHLYVPFCQATHLPFVICDPESFNDQVHMFTETGTLAEFTKPYEEEKYSFNMAEIAVPHRLQFLISLLTIGVNSIVLHEGEACSEAEISEIVNVVDYSKVPEEKRPLLNPQLHLSTIYFVQELRRPIQDRNLEKLAELEEEMCVNLVRSSYLFPIDVVEEEGDPEKKTIRFPYLKDGSDQMLQPIFTDGPELQRFLKGKKLQIRKVKFEDLDKYLSKDSIGYTLNPFGVNLVLKREQIPELLERFQKVEE